MARKNFSNGTALGSAYRMGAAATIDTPNEGGIPAQTEPPKADSVTLRLEKRTHLDQARYKATLYNYAPGLAEIGWSFIPSLLPAKAGRGESVNRALNEDRAVRRARSKLRRKILAAQADHLLTLTYRENIVDFNQASTDLNRFVRIVKSQLPNWIYIAVAEHQERGAWHWHMAVKGRQDVVFLRSTWRHVVGEGNIDVRPPKGSGRYRLLGLVRYLGKYLAKGFGDNDHALNARRFRSSLGIVIPSQTLSVPKESYSDVKGFALSVLRGTAGTNGFSWQSDDGQSGWACSWK
ncbi:MAG: hypothetical protein B7X28_01995 [Halothiobacillus sp. 13-55-253]|jgi:hypothetical protein|nr:MAG: hypothetical protein B7X28_01995 [Halothiobacillus sp. 13-55-253]